MTPALGAWSASAINGFLGELEEHTDLLSHTVSGWSAWPVVRMGVFYSLFGHATTAQSSQRRRHFSLLRHSVGDMAQFVRLGEARYMFFSHASNRSDTEAGRFRDIYYDDLIRHIDVEMPASKGASACLKLELPDNPLFAPRTHHALVPPSMGATLPLVLSSLAAAVAGPSHADSAAKAIASVLRDAAGYEVVTVRSLRQQLRKFHWSKRTFGAILDRTRPRRLVVLTAYGIHGIVAAAKERGIPVIELQHGYLASTHIGYAWRASARKYRAKMSLPDVLAVYGDHWAEELRSGGFWGDDVVVGGSLQLDRYRARRASRAIEPLSVTFTEQGVATERVISYLAEFLYAAGQTDIRLYVKLHPSQRDVAPFAQRLGNDSRVRIVPASSDPATFDLLSRSQLHASMFSTCHYEALALGVPTAIVPLVPEVDIVLPLVATGCAHVCSTPAELLQLLTRQGDVSIPRSVQERFFAMNALERLNAIVTGSAA